MLQIGNTNFCDKDKDLNKVYARKMDIIKSIDERIKLLKSDTALEIGSGLGIHTRFLSEAARLVYTVDVSEGFSEYFESFCGKRDNVRRIIANFFPMMDGIPDGSVDCGLSLAVFCHLHVYDVFLYLEEISRKLKSNGRFFLNFQNSDNQCLDSQPFVDSVITYRKGGMFVPIHVAQLQYHSRDFFRAAGMRFGLAVSYETSKGSYTEMLFRKVS